MGQLLDNIIKKYKTKGTRNIELIFIKYKNDIDEAIERGYKKEDIVKEINALENITIDLSNFYYYTRKIEKNKNNTTTSNLELKEAENKKATDKELVNDKEPIKIVPRGANSTVYKFKFKQNGSEYYPVTTRTQAFSSEKDVKNWLKKKEKSKSKEMGYPVTYELISCEAIA